MAGDSVKLCETHIYVLKVKITFFIPSLGYFNEQKSSGDIIQYTGKHSTRGAWAAARISRGHTRMCSVFIEQKS